MVVNQKQISHIFLFRKQLFHVIAIFLFFKKNENILMVKKLDLWKFFLWQWYKFISFRSTQKNKYKCNDMIYMVEITNNLNSACCHIHTASAKTHIATNHACTHM